MAKPLKKVDKGEYRKEQQPNKHLKIIHKKCCWGSTSLCPMHFVCFFQLIYCRSFTSNKILRRSQVCPKRFRRRSLKPTEKMILHLGQNPRYLFGDYYQPKVVDFKGFWDVHYIGYRGFDPQPNGLSTL